jgi:GH25 family lysozyme M1 (1,4-beta-N-acetylmuramidase)
MDFIRAVDLSNFQDLTPQIARALKADGVELVIVRASHERQALVDIAQRQMQIVLDAGMRLHAYGWCYFTADPSDTVAHWRDYYDRFPIGRFWLDCEETRYAGDPGSNERWLVIVHAQLAETWPLGIYTGRWWWVPRMGNSDAFNDLPLWDADYTGTPQLEMPVPYGGWTRRAIHQYDGTGSMAGLGPLDLDAVDPALLGEDDDMQQMKEVQRIARDEIIRNIRGALSFKSLPVGARVMLESGALPAAQTLARGLEPGEGDG